MRIQIKDIYTIQPDLSVKKCDVYISGGYIMGVNNKPDGFMASKIINGGNRLLMPGLINSHTHTYMNLFRNSADDLSFSEWLFEKIEPMEDRLLPDDAYWGAMLACMEMLSTGTTCFLDMHMFRHQIAKAVYDSGIRGVLSRGLVGEGNNDAGKIRLCDALEEMSKWKECDRLSFMFGPHAVYTCDEEYLNIVSEAAKNCGVGINVHASESRFEIEECKKKYGVSPIELLERTGCFDGQAVIAHGVYLSDNDRQILKKHDVSVASCPKSNAKLGNGAAEIGKMQKDGIRVCLGTDSVASNNSLNMFSEMNAMAMYHKCVEEDARAVSAYDVFKMATVNGADALGIKAGMISPGMLADMVILNLDKPQFYPRNDIIAAMSYSAMGSEVETVLVNGDVVYDRGDFTNIDKERVYYEVEKIARRIR